MEQEKKKLNLKIIIPIIIAIGVLAVVGIAFFMGSKQLKKMSKEEMLEIAQEITTKDIYEDFGINEKNAREKYIGNIYKYTGVVKEVGDNYVSLDSQSNHIGEYKKIYLSEEELKQVYKGQSITVVGKITKISGNAYFKSAYFEMKDAYNATRMATQEEKQELLDKIDATIKNLEN